MLHHGATMSTRSLPSLLATALLALTACNVEDTEQDPPGRPRPDMAAPDLDVPDLDVPDLTPDLDAPDFAPDLPANRAPVWDNLPGAASALWGRAGAFAPAASDPDGQAVTVTVVDTSCSFEVALGADGALSFTCPLATEDCAANLRASDGELSADAALTISCANALPTAAEVTISPGAADRATPLTCAYTFADADGDADASAIVWTVNGAPAGAGSTLAAGYVRGDAVVCAVTPNDGLSDGVSASSAPLIIANAAPSAADVAISPNPADPSSPLSCDYSFIDPDMDADASTIAWTINGAPAGAGLTITSGYLRGDTVVCTVTPNDGALAGSPVSSAPVSIGNRTPTAAGVAISPGSADRATPLTCAYTFADADGDADASAIAWTVNGAPAGAGSTLAAGYVRGDIVICAVTPNDGQADGVVVMSAPLTIGNAAPSAANVAISPTRATRATPLTCTFDFADIDGDMSASTIAWTVNGAPAGTGATLTTGYTRGQTVRCAVTPNDGTTSGAAVASAPVVIDNAAPVATNVRITPSPAYRNTAMTCAFDFADVDGDMSASTIAWTVNGAPAGAGATLTTGYTRGDAVSCAVTPRDAAGPGAVATSATITIGNRAPTASNILISPNPAPAPGTPLSCQFNTNDPDGDLTSGSIEWVRNGVAVSTSPTFLSYSRADTVTCRVTATDGLIAGAPASSPPLALPDFTDVSAGGEHGCAIKNGALSCWGDNQFGELGDGTTTNRSAPALVTGMGANVNAVGVGPAHTCALRGDAVLCWGSGGNGRTGSGSSAPQLTPLLVAGMESGVTALSVGDSHTCAIKSGALWCWGFNGNGALGDGTTAGRDAPVAVTNMTSGVTAVSAGHRHTCAIRAGSLLCWGRNNNAQLGDGSTTERLTPAQVSGITSGATAVATAFDHTCAVQSGAAKCWGNNFNTRLGNTTGNSAVPAQVTDMTAGVTAIITGINHSCAIQSGAAKCWGRNEESQLGDGTLTTSAAPSQVSGLGSGVTSISATNDTTCAVRDNLVRCWGRNNRAQLARASADTSTPKLVATLPTTTGVLTTGSFHTCATNAAGGLLCWGLNTSGQVGDGSTFITDPTPRQVSGLAAGVSAASAGNAMTCAVSSGALRCWGQNDQGMIGDGSVINRLTPTASMGLGSGVLAVSSGFNQTCVIQNGAAKCWGNNDNGKVGDGTTALRLTPVQVVGLTSDVTSISTALLHTCAVRSGAAYCWGNNTDGRVGNGTTSTSVLTPVAVVGMGSGVTSVVTGREHSCAIQSGAVKCWGSNSQGKLGDDTSTARSAPVQVVGLTANVTAVASTQLASHSCAIQSGALYCWGRNDEGQLGDGTNSARFTPTLVPGMGSAVSAISVGSGHTCAIQNGALYCWGLGLYAHTGVGLGMAPTPLLVTLP
jgi:alpha-tubulin suppressor-like RCC1 family protein